MQKHENIHTVLQLYTSIKKQEIEEDNISMIVYRKDK